MAIESTLHTNSAPHTVTATLQYFTPPADGSKPWISATERVPGTLQSASNWKHKAHVVEIEDIRGRETDLEEISLDKTGFQYFKRKTEFDFGGKGGAASDEAIEKAYYPESIQLIKDYTGASRVVLFDHTIRRNRPGDTDESPSNRHPVSQVHVDQTTAAAVARVHRHLPASDAPELLKKRFQIINLWRPINHPALDWPLALCDCRSVDLSRDLVPMTLRYPDRDGEVSAVKFSPEHRWKYIRGLTPEEGVLIKCFDSQQDGSVAILTPHTAFEDPTTPPDAPLRESIELRALVFYD
ncbi:uncharacterized protein STEHIDRAFT_82768 [Stereum hirsutum FP-91666 SS1]|uniref:uncharacterized protein n=1 Tax=Stereum hirsutum (strain FP-91666) TaxID=721885 RepID=UPI000444A692|nr:uncharacterized protein STEHIDRAFT_82768 [Stereum hirsutum FP-91666 SS1]EIM83876.1 hypothetical protein STEHIDRAFT_82768 [Stereum hirsutum FP-91666 SS1]